MSISFGSAASSSNLNAAFISKTSDSTTVGVLDLDAAASGDQITNIQLEVNNKTFKNYTVESITAAGEVTISLTKGMQRRKVQSAGGALTASVTPFGVAGGWADGMQIRLRGDSDTDTLELTGVATASTVDYGVILNGTIVLQKWTQITLEWDELELRWYEISRNS